MKRMMEEEDMIAGLIIGFIIIAEAGCITAGVLLSK